jgi:hypothetical protein
MMRVVYARLVTSHHIDLKRQLREQFRQTLGILAQYRQGRLEHIGIAVA